MQSVTNFVTSLPCLLALAVTAGAAVHVDHGKTSLATEDYSLPSLFGTARHAILPNVQNLFGAAERTESRKPNPTPEEHVEDLERKIEEHEGNINDDIKELKEHPENHRKVLMNAIERFRAEICYHMKDQYGVEFNTFEACHKFMKKTCRPGEDMKMDGDKHERSTGEGWCTEYFPGAEKKAEEEVAEAEKRMEAEALKEEYEVQAGPAPGPALQPAPAPSTEKAKPEKAEAPAAAVQGQAPSPAASSAPAGGPAGAPGEASGDGKFTPGKDSGKPPGEIGDDEAYYFNKEGKDKWARLHMDENMKLPTQGYWGKLVEHEDMQTMTDDWQEEFGPKARLNALKKVCREHPHSHWCKDFLAPKHRLPWERSSSMPVSTHSLACGLALFAALAF